MKKIMKMPKTKFKNFRPKINEECGVFGISNNKDASTLTALGLHALQHRGQEGCGIVSYDGKKYHSEKRFGLVGDNFNKEKVLRNLPGNYAIGHNRYSTTGGTTLRNIQPFFADTNTGGIGVSHNGNLTNAITLRKKLVDEGAIFYTTSDTETIVQLIAKSKRSKTIDKVVDALIAASKAGIDLTFEIATAIDLAGRDVLSAVQTSVYPKVIDAPVDGKLSAVAKDGIEVRARARVTVRTDIPNLVGGATEDTIIARVGEGIVSAIGSKETYEAVLENPDSISKNVLNKGLNHGTAFEILSIDIADIDVGKNIGAQLQADQAEADLRVAQAKAETRRAMAVALEQEMKAKVVEAESEVPKAMAEAFRKGNLGVLDYYKLENIASDTSMRHSIAGTPDEKDDSVEE